MLEAIRERWTCVAAGIVAGAGCWLTSHLSSGDAFATPLAAVAGGFVANLFLTRRLTPAAGRSEEFFAALFGSLLAAVALQTGAQGGLF